MDPVAGRAQRRDARGGPGSTSSRSASCAGRSATRPSTWSTPRTWPGSVPPAPRSRRSPRRCGALGFGGVHASAVAALAAARPGRGPLPRRLRAAQAADRRPVPAGHPAAVPRLRGSRRSAAGIAGTRLAVVEHPRRRWPTPTGRPGPAGVADRSRALIATTGSRGALPVGDRRPGRGRRRGRPAPGPTCSTASGCAGASAAGTPASTSGRRHEIVRAERGHPVRRSAPAPSSRRPASVVGRPAAGRDFDLTAQEADRRPAGGARAAPTPRSAPACSSAPTPSTTTCARCSRSSASPRAASSSTGSAATRAAELSDYVVHVVRGRGRAAVRLEMSTRAEEDTMPYVTSRRRRPDLLQGLGQRGTPVILSHGWPLNADAWEAAALFLAEHGHRAIAHDRRGHGRSTQTWHGNEMDTYADDLATPDRHPRPARRHPGRPLHRRRRDRPLRRPARHRRGSPSWSWSPPCPPLMLRTDDNPEGLPIEVFDEIRAGEAADRSQLYRDLADGPFFGHNRKQRRRPGLPGRVLAAEHGLRAPRRVRVHRRLLRHRLPARPGRDRRARRWSSTATTTRSCRSRSAASAPRELVDGAVLKVYEGGAHALPDTDRDRLHADLLDVHRLLTPKPDHHDRTPTEPTTATEPRHHRPRPRPLDDPAQLGGLGRRTTRPRASRSLTPGYPGFEIEVEALRENPDIIANLTVPETVDHLAARDRGRRRRRRSSWATRSAAP